MYNKVVKAIKSFDVTLFDSLLSDKNVQLFKGDKNILVKAIESKYTYFIEQILKHNNLNPNSDAINVCTKFICFYDSSYVLAFISHPKINLKVFGKEFHILCSTYCRKDCITFLETNGISSHPLLLDGYDQMISFKYECQKIINSGISRFQADVDFVFDVEMFVKEGFTPIQCKDEIEFYITRSHTNPFIATDFWHNTKRNFRYIRFWWYASNECKVKRALENCDSFDLLFDRREFLYPSMRPITDMKLFQTEKAGMYTSDMIFNHISNQDSSLVCSEVLSHEGFLQFLRVTRYSKGMTRGLYHKSTQKRVYTGRFYYLEPDSTTLLTFINTNVRIYKNKYLAALDLCSHALMGAFSATPFQRDFLAGKNPNIPNDLMMTPKELFQIMPTIDFLSGAKVNVNINMANNAPNDKEYVGMVLGFYALEDSLDIDLYYASKKLGIDVLVFTHMVGSRKIVSEVYDIREDSFDHLLYLK